jgi:sulfide:quinone oxidoreductase
MNPSDDRLRALIVGGGVAALEAAAALRSLAGDRVAVRLLAPDGDFLYRPMTVVEPFSLGNAQRYRLDRLASEIGFELHQDAFARLDAHSRTVHTAGGDALSYDVLLLATGALVRPAFSEAITLDVDRLEAQMRGLVLDVEGGYLHRLGFVVPAGPTWPLPAYELALMTAARADDMNATVAVTLITSEPAPLAAFGEEASDAVRELLASEGVALVCESTCAIDTPGQISIAPGSRELIVDRVISLPELFGPFLNGVPSGTSGGFVPVDELCRVRGLDQVYAAGDMTDGPVKHGSLAAQQADVAATAIAAAAGAAVTPHPYEGRIEAVLLGGRRPLHVRAQLTGAHPSQSHVDPLAERMPEHKLSARYLTPHLDRLA